MVNDRDIFHLISYVLDELQKGAKKPGWNNPYAKIFVLRIGAVESQYRYLRQRTGKGQIGVARGFWQFEPWVAQSILNDYLEYRLNIYEDVERITLCDLSKLDDPHEREYMAIQLQSNIMLGIALCRVKLRPIPEPIPETVEGQAEQWLKYYNAGGKGSIEHFIESAKSLRV